MYKLILSILTIISLTACGESSQSSKVAKGVEQQQAQYAITQPVPRFDYSLERDLLIQLYNIRNMKALTHAVWRSDRGLIEGDCPSIGFGIPYDISLTNPLKLNSRSSGGVIVFGTIEQPEPNGIFASKNTAATWVMCAGQVGQIEPIYIETKVTVYPYPVKVDYGKNRVTKVGKATVTIKR